MKRYKRAEEETSDGKKLSREGLKIFNKQGEKAYDQWTKEVFLPLMDAKLKRLRACSLK
jgi:hypothetical protein